MKLFWPRLIRVGQFYQLKRPNQAGAKIGFLVLYAVQIFNHRHLHLPAKGEVAHEHEPEPRRKINRRAATVLDFSFALKIILGLAHVQFGDHVQPSGKPALRRQIEADDVTVPQLAAIGAAGFETGAEKDGHKIVEVIQLNSQNAGRRAGADLIVRLQHEAIIIEAVGFAEGQTRSGRCRERNGIIKKRTEMGNYKDFRIAQAFDLKVVEALCEAVKNIRHADRGHDAIADAIIQNRLNAVLRLVLQNGGLVVAIRTVAMIIRMNVQRGFGDIKIFQSENPFALRQQAGIVDKKSLIAAAANRAGALLKITLENKRAARRRENRGIGNELQFKIVLAFC